jgi:hypothetical protein
MTAEPPRSEPSESERGSPLERQIAPEVSRRVSSILDAVEHEAERMREEAREESSRYLDYSRRRADALVAERQRRIGELSDEIMEKAEAVVARLDDAAPVREGFENLVRALGDAAERLAREAEQSQHDFEPPAFHVGDPQPSQPPMQSSPRPTPEPPPAPSPPAHSEASTYYQRPPTPDPGPIPPPQAPAAPDTPVPGQPAPDPRRIASAESAPPPRPAAPPSATEREGEQPGSDAGSGLDNARLIAIQMAAAGRTRREVGEHLQDQVGVSASGTILDEIFGAGSAEDARVPWTTSFSS